jgi:hypothetical protein
LKIDTKDDDGTTKWIMDFLDAPRGVGGAEEPGDHPEKQGGALV